MPSAHLAFGAGVPGPIRAGVAALRERLGVPDAFGAAALAEAEAAASAPALPARDATDIPFVTIDPEGSTDLDQAVHLERNGDGYRVRYAIADLAAFVAPGGALDAEVHARGLTLYAPHGRTPLHPPVLSEGAASLLPGQVRPALLWDLGLDAAGRLTRASVARARVRSREQLTYAGVQAALDGGTAPELLMLLREVGLLRERLEAERGGVSLREPEQEVVARDGSWELEFRRPLPVEGWNAQISLMTGMAAAESMLAGKVGVLRTLPPAEQSGIDRLRHVAKALRIAWPGGVSYPEFVRGLDPEVPAHLAMQTACSRLFRGAGYVAFDGTVPEQPLHGALAAPYAHCTAPLRRLVDRYVGEVCVALSAGEPVPGWALSALSGLPDAMAAADARAKKYERGLVDLAEALVLQPLVGRTLTGGVVEANDHGGVVQLESPAVEGRFSGRARLGDRVRVRVESVDLSAGTFVLTAI